MTKREIKFRAWDEKEKCWVSGFAIHQSGMFSDWAGCKKINGQCVAEADWKYQHEIPHIKIMQYTGLKDKNGRKIYEGDVIGRKSTITGEMYYYKVEWDAETARFMAVGETIHELVSSSLERGNVWLGNIYEHPHLLKGEENA